MKKYLVQAKNNPLISGSVVIFIGANLANAFNFLYSLYVSRSLAAADLGTLFSLISIIALFSVPANSLIPTIVNFAATFFARKELGKLRGLFLQFGKLCFFVGIALFLLSFLFASQASAFLKIPDPMLITIAGLTILIGYLSTTNTAFLQAKLAFTFTSLINVSGTLLKFLATILFLSFGFGVRGALWGFFLAYLIPYVLSFLQLRFVADRTIALSKHKMQELVSYGVPATIALFSLTSFTSMDVVLVKHFFSPDQAGYYAVLSVVGRIIYFLTSPINSVMFPLVVQKFTKGEPFRNIFIFSFVCVCLPSLALTICYFLFPEFIIRLIANKTYHGYLGLFAIYISGFALVQVLTNFYLSIKRTRVFIPILIGALLQVGLIWLFHSSLQDIIVISSGIVFVLLFGLLLYYPYATKRTE